MMKDKIKHSILAEKYRPTELNEYVGNEKLKDFISQCIQDNDIPHLLLYSGPGTGKTTLAKLIINNIDCDYIYINASEERGMDVIRDKVMRFASSATFEPLKVVILDEADFMTPTALASLRNILETFSNTTRFILTCNYIEKIPDPIKSRCQTIKINPPSKMDVAKHLNNVMEKEGIIYEPKDLGLIITKHYPDIRKMFNNIQLSINKNTNTLTLDKSLLVSSIYIDEVIESLKKPTHKTLSNIRQIIADSGTSDFDELYRVLFDKIEEYSSGNEVGLCIIAIHDHMYKANFRIDKEINIISLISTILNIKK